MTVTKQALAEKIRNCVSKLQQYETIINNRIKVHDSHLTDIATAYRQLKTEMYAIRRDEQINDAIIPDHEVVIIHIEQKREKLYVRSVELLATIELEMKAAVHD